MTQEGFVSFNFLFHLTPPSLSFAQRNEDESMVSFIRKAVEERIERLTDQDRKDTIINLMAFSQDQTSSYTEDDLVESSVSEVRKYRSSKK